MLQELIHTKLPVVDSPRAEDGRKLDVKVIFTDLPRTAAALATARVMAQGLGARITVLMAQVVPYPLPLADPPVSVVFAREQIASVAAGDDTTVEILLCRDRHETLSRALPPDAVVIVGTPKRRWWPSWERTLARILRRDGRRVLVIAV